MTHVAIEHKKLAMNEHNVSYGHRILATN